MIFVRVGSKVSRLGNTEWSLITLMAFLLLSVNCG